MSDTAWVGRATDEELADISRDGTLAILGGDSEYHRSGLKDIAAELLRLRRVIRGDSRRAEQLKKLRWAVEVTLTKIEHVGMAGAFDEIVDTVKLAKVGCGCNVKDCVHARIRAEIGLAP